MQTQIIRMAGRQATPVRDGSAELADMRRQMDHMWTQVHEMQREQEMEAVALEDRRATEAANLMLAAAGLPTLPIPAMPRSYTPPVAESEQITALADRFIRAAGVDPKPSTSQTPPAPAKASPQRQGTVHLGEAAPRHAAGEDQVAAAFIAAALAPGYRYDGE